jgi:enoyl-CoA hydratase/carnithine racemase
MGVTLQLENGVARVTISRPEVMNALDANAQQEMENIWQRLECNPDLRVVVVTGEGDRAFCAGADIKGGGSRGLDYWAHPIPKGFGGLPLRDTLKVPVIARVNGFALGGGLELMLGCDIAIACDDASFGLPEPRVGRMPLDGGMSLLHRQVSYRQAMGLLLTGRHIGANEALQMGLINEVVPRQGLDGAIARWVDDVLACAPLSLRAIKAFVRSTHGLSPTASQAMRLPELVDALESEDAMEGVLAFKERRKPVWKGR